MGLIDAIRTKGNKREAGFTLIELMVVVAIIAILAAIGVPRMNAFIRTSETSEATTTFGAISKALSGYSSVNPNQVSSLTNRYLSLTATGGAGSLSLAIPHLTLATNAKWGYKLVATSDDVYCIVAEKDTYRAYYSTDAGTTANGWDRNVSVVNYVTSGAQSPTATTGCTAGALSVAYP